MITYVKKNGEWTMQFNGALSSPIEELDSSVRTWKYLKNLGIDTIGELISYDGKFFLAQDMFSLKVLDEIILRLEAMGLGLADNQNGEFTSGAEYFQFYRSKWFQQCEAERKEEGRIERNERARIRYHERKRLAAAASQKPLSTL